MDHYLGDGLPTFRDIFRFAPGDVAAFRNGSETRTYEAVEHVTPILNLEVYFDNGVFKRSDLTETVKYVDPDYQYESIIFAKSPTPRFCSIAALAHSHQLTLKIVWNGVSLPNSLRLEEIQRNTLEVCRACCWCRKHQVSPQRQRFDCEAWHLPTQHQVKKCWLHHWNLRLGKHKHSCCGTETFVLSWHNFPV